MDRLGLVFIALFGLFAVVANKKFADGSSRASRTYFGRDMREGSVSYTAARVMTVVVGAALFVLGLLGVFGVIYN